MRAWALQFRVHDQSHGRDRDDVSRRWNLFQSLGRLWHVLLRALPPEFQGIFRNGPSADSRSTGPGPQAIHHVAAATAIRTLAVMGRNDQKDQSERKLHG